jgi:hypothetical protein
MAPLILAAALIAAGILAGEAAQRAYRHRLAEAGRSRTPPATEDQHSYGKQLRVLGYRTLC